MVRMCALRVALRGSVRVRSFTYCLSLMKLHISKCEICTIFKPFRNGLIALEQIHDFGANVVAEASHRSPTFNLMT